MALVPVIVLERFDQKYSSIGVGLVYGVEGISVLMGYGLSRKFEYCIVTSIF